MSSLDLSLIFKAEYPSLFSIVPCCSSTDHLLPVNVSRLRAEALQVPGTYFIPDLLVDFQSLKTTPPKEIEKLCVIASLDSPFAEALPSRFARYFGRLGTPDLDKQVVIKRLEAI